MNESVFEQAKKRTERYWYEDGIWEIGFGLVNILLGGFFVLARWLLAQGINGAPHILLQLVTIWGAFWLMGRLVKLLKERITYPRTGYVVYRKQARPARFRRFFLMVLISGGVAALVGVVATLRANIPLTPVVSSMIFAAMLIYLGIRFNLMRLYALAPLVIGVAIAVAYSRMEETLSMAVFFGGLGLLFILSGGWALALYLRRTRPASEVADYEAPENPAED